MDEIQLEIKEYLRQNMGIYIFITGIFVLGIMAGALAVRSLDENCRLALNQYFSFFINNVGETGALDQVSIFRASLRMNFQYLFLTWVLGIFLFGFPVISGIVALRGFSVGFTVGFLVERASIRGLLFALGSVLPHNLVLAPAVVVIAVTGFSFSWLRFRSYLEKRPCAARGHIGPYTLAIFLVGVVLFLGVLVEAYISPVFVRVLIPVIR